MNRFSHPELAQPRPSSAPSGRGVTAVLGPTNTGKTHLAIERMVAQPSGMIGLPLRLLAREVYGRVIERVGKEAVALITGEEKIIPAGARFLVCTVEAMPSSADTHFVAIDEIQLAADLTRGHIFTDRLLHLRGTHETMLLGAATLRGPLEALLPGINVITRPRMSQLLYAGSKKITRLPRRSAIVAFSADEVYEIAELIRRQRGAAAVVLGSLSPRTRNAQVALYQSGDVDYLVATDAIGMGLNLDVDHVAFAATEKFDGTHRRRLKPAEFAQIAGRAGRHTKDGTFGVTGKVDPFEDELVQRLESHEFPPEKLLQWRSRDLDFSTIPALVQSLEKPSDHPVLVKAPTAVDQRALAHMASLPRVRQRASIPETVQLLWDVAQIPDYRKIAPANHGDLLAAIYADLADSGRIDEDWFANQVRQTDVTEGDIDALSNRIAHIRTWTFVSHRTGWLSDPHHWQAETRAIEDRLSDALHERLTKRFVDRRTSLLMKRLRENSMLEAEIAASGAVTVEGHHVGELTGFRFAPDQAAGDGDAKAMKAAAQKALASEFDARSTRLAAAPNGDIALDSDGTMRWLGAPVARLAASEDILKPRLLLLADELLAGPARERVTARLERWLGHQIETHLKPLQDLAAAEEIDGMARGIAFRLAEEMGALDRRSVAADIHALEQDQRAQLRKKGVRFGAHHIFVPALVKPAPAELAAQLWALKNDAMEQPGRQEIVAALAAGRTSMPVDTAFSDTLYRLAGYRVLGVRAVRIDILERLADLIRPLQQWRFDPAKPAKRPEGAWDGGGFTVTPPMLSILGATAEDMAAILSGLGYKGEAMEADRVNAKWQQWDAAAEPAPAEQKTEAVAETTAEAAPASPQPESAPAAETVEAEPEAPAEATAAEDTTASAEEAEPPKPITIWRLPRPERRGASRQHRGNRQSADGQERDAKQRGPRRDNVSKGPHRGPRKGKNKPQAQHGGDNKQRNRPNREPDPDSPFATLAALKASLTESK